jgi:hypothetical protein
MGKIIGKSVLCFAGLAVVSWLLILLDDWKKRGMYLHVYRLTILADAFLHISSIFFISFQNIRFVFLLVSIIYAGILYLFFRRHKHSILIIIANTAVIASFWFVVFIPDMPYYIYQLCTKLTHVGFAGITAIITIVLAFVFRSVEKHRLLSANQKASLRRIPICRAEASQRARSSHQPNATSAAASLSRAQRNTANDPPGGTIYRPE